VWAPDRSVELVAMRDAFGVETARLRLREFVAGDVPALQAMHREPRVRALLVDDYPLDHAAVAAFFVERLQTIYRAQEGLGIWHAERRDDDGAWHFCGWFNLMRMPDDPSRVEIGCRLLPAAWGTGLAVEGGHALLRHAFERLRLAAVWGICRPQHHAVRAVLRTLGFADRGLQPYDGRPAAHFSIDPAQWRAAARVPLRQRVRDAVRAERRAAPRRDAVAA
jgi:RimJ/RimL family protein N-acetyltransferase